MSSDGDQRQSCGDREQMGQPSDWDWDQQHQSSPSCEDHKPFFAELHGQSSGLHRQSSPSGEDQKPPCEELQADQCSNGEEQKVKSSIWDQQQSCVVEKLQSCSNVDDQKPSPAERHDPAGKESRDRGEWPRADSEFTVHPTL